MASIMGKRAILGKNTRLFLLLFALWAANLCAGGVLPTSFGPYRNGTTTINTTASSPGTSSPPPQVGPGQGVINTAHSPTEYWCFDIFHLSYVECCGLGDDADECNHAAVCFDQVDCEEGCELDMPTSAESGTISFTCAAATETCATDVTTRSGDGIATTSSILSCAAATITATISAISPVTTASTTENPLANGNGTTSYYLNPSKTPLESAISKTAKTGTTNSTKLTTFVLPGLPTSRATTTAISISSLLTSSPASSLTMTTSTTTDNPLSVVVTATSSSTETTTTMHNSTPTAPGPTGTLAASSPQPEFATAADPGPLWKNFGFFGGIGMGIFLAIILWVALRAEFKLHQVKAREAEEQTLERKLTRRLWRRKNKGPDSSGCSAAAPAVVTGVVCSTSTTVNNSSGSGSRSGGGRHGAFLTKLNMKTSRDRGFGWPCDDKDDIVVKDGKLIITPSSSSLGNSSSLPTTSSVNTRGAEILAALAKSESGVLYDRSGSIRYEDFSRPTIREREYARALALEREREAEAERVGASGGEKSCTEQGELVPAQEYEPKTAHNTEPEPEPEPEADGRGYTSFETSTGTVIHHYSDEKEEEGPDQTVQIQEATAVRLVAGQGRQIVHVPSKPQLVGSDSTNKSE